MSGRPSYAELHCHTNFSFLDGASAADELVDRAVELGLSALAVTDHQGLYGVVRFATAAHDAGIHPVIGLELELVDPFVADPARIVVPAHRPARRGGRRRSSGPAGMALPATCRTAGHRFGRGRSGPGCRVTGTPSRRTSAGSARGNAARTSSSWPAIGSATGACAGSSAGQTWPGRRACRGSARHSWPSTPRASWRCRAVATARSPVGSGSATARGPGRSRRATPGCSAGARGPVRGRVGATAPARWAADVPAGAGRPGWRRPGSSSSSNITSCPTTTGSWPRPPGWPRSSVSPSSSRTTSTTRCPRAASSRTSSRRSATAGRSGRWPISVDPTASRTSSPARS